MNRRSFLKWSVAGALISTTRLEAGSASSFATLRERSLSFQNLHTDEKLRVTYWADGAYVPSSLSEIHHILRDHRTDETYPINTELLDLLCRIRTEMDSAGPFEIISGYRSPKTNAMLREHSGGVAETSLHLKGMAVDIRLRDKSVLALQQAALSLKAGGVGYYKASQFVHVDVGRVRRWNG